VKLLAVCQEKKKRRKGEGSSVALAVELRQFTDVFNFASDKRYFGTREHRDGGDSSSMPDKKSAEHCCSVSVTNNVEAPRQRRGGRGQQIN